MGCIIACVGVGVGCTALIGVDVGVMLAVGVDVGVGVGVSELIVGVGEGARAVASVAT